MAEAASGVGVLPGLPASGGRAADAKQSLERGRTDANRTVRVGVFVLGSVGLLAVHVAFGHDDYDIWARIFAALSGIVTLAALVTARPGTAPYAAYATTLLYLSYGASTFSAADFHGALGPIPIQQDSLTQASFAALLVSVAIVTFVPLGSRLGAFAAPQVARFVPRTLGPGFVEAAYLVSGGIVLANAVLNIYPSLVPQALAFPAYALSRPALAQGLLVVASGPSRSARPRQIAVLLTALASLAGLSSGSMSPTLSPWVSLAMFTWVVERRAPWRPALFVLGLMLILNPAKHTYREIVWFGGGSRDFSLLERASVWQEAVVKTWSGEADQSARNLESTTDRISLLVYAAQGIEWVPSPVPETGFARWWDIPSAFVPRILWPEKPILTIENNVAYTTTFGLQTTETSRTATIAFPIVVDGYWAAGYLGVVVGGVLLGLLYGILQGVLPASQWSTLVVGVASLTIIQPTVNLAVNVSGIPQLVTAACAVTWCVWWAARLVGAQDRRSTSGAQALRQ